MADGWKVNENDRYIAMTGVLNQAKAAGLDLNDLKVQTFIDNQIEVIAHWHAQCRWQQNIINKGSLE